jgi:hypothetical protein
MWTWDHAPNARKGADASWCDHRPPQAIPGHSRLQQHRVDQHCAARSSCDSRQGDLLTIPHARAGWGTKRWLLPIALVKDRGTTTKTVAPACSTGDGQGRDVHTPSLSTVGPTGLACGGEGRCSPRALFSSLSFSCTLDPSLGLYKGRLGTPLGQDF